MSKTPEVTIGGFVKVKIDGFVYDGFVVGGQVIEPGSERDLSECFGYRRGTVRREVQIQLLDAKE